MVTENRGVVDSGELGSERNESDGIEHEARVIDESKATFGLGQNVAGALSYVLGFVTGLLFYLVEDENEFVRFHAVQSMITFGGIFALSLVLGIVPIFFEFIPVVGVLMGLVFGLISLLLGPVALVLWIALIVKAYKGERYMLPVVGEMAKRYV